MFGATSATCTIMPILPRLTKKLMYDTSQVVIYPYAFGQYQQAKMRNRAKNIKRQKTKEAWARFIAKHKLQ